MYLKFVFVFNLKIENRNYRFGMYFLYVLFLERYKNKYIFNVVIFLVYRVLKIIYLLML